MEMRSNLIYDAGAHRGEDTEFYLKKGFDVVSIEAHPELAKELRTRFAREIATGQLIVVEAAIAEHHGTIDFYTNDVISVWGTTQPEWVKRNERHDAPSTCITVKATTFSDILRRYGVPYYLKIDIEGADLLCVKAFVGEREKPKFISIESNKRCWQGLLDEFELLKQLGYKRFKLIDQVLVELQEVPVPAREGRPGVAHQFEIGSSGLFGEELPGQWLNPEEAIAKYRRIFPKYKLLGDDSLPMKIVQGLRGIRASARERVGDVGESNPSSAKVTGLSFNTLYKALHRRLAAHWFDTHATLGT